MLNGKQFIPVLLEIFTKTSQVSQSVTESTKFIKESLQYEFLNMAMKLFFGIILTSVIIFSLISVGQQVHLYFFSLENGLAISILVFTFVAIASALGLRHLLKSRLTGHVVAAEEASTLSLHVILTQLLLGITEGLEEASAKHRGTAAGASDTKAAVPPSINPESVTDVADGRSSSMFP